MSKQKLNFATRVASMAVSKSDSNNAYNAERAKIQASINSHPVIIDYTCFQKTDKEKLELANAKIQYKKKMQS